MLARKLCDRSLLRVTMSTPPSMTSPLPIWTHPDTAGRVGVPVFDNSPEFAL